MKYFYDCEFCEDGRTIDLISIGVVADDGREFYGQNKECDFSKANEWVRQNVFPHLECFDIETLTPKRHKDGNEGRWYTRQEMRGQILSLCAAFAYDKPEFWGYYSAYDHVALCQLFGRMIDLPSDWPMYTRDLKQWCDQLGNPQLPPQDENEHHALADARWNREVWKYLDLLSIRGVMPLRPEGFMASPIPIEKQKL